MKVDKTKIRYTTELPPDCKVVIERLKKSSRHELIQYLREFQLWNLSKSELAYWSTVLDIFDGILEECSQPVNSNIWCLNCDKPENAELRETACCVLNFMALLIEHTFGRHIFSSIDRIILLLNTSDVSLLNATLSLLYSFSKRSSFIQRLDADVHGVLMKKMMSISESWGERENGFSLADCCRHISVQSFPRNPLSFSFEYYFVPDQGDPSAAKLKKPAASTAPSQLACLRCDLAEEPFANISTGEIMIKLLNDHRIPDTKHQQLFHRLRLARGFADYSTRLQLIESRLLTLTTLIYCRTISSSAITTTFIEELAELLQLSLSTTEYIGRLAQLKGAALKLLTALVHAELNGYKKLSTIVDCLGVNDYHGFLPSLFRQTVQTLLEEKSEGTISELTRPNGFTTCIFSLLYHMATIEPTGSGALLAAGLVEPLLKVVAWYSHTEENLAYVTRAVRVVNLICDYDATSFFQLGGLGICVQRLEHDVEVCRREEPFEIQGEWLQLYMDPVQGADQQQQQQQEVGASGDVSAASPGTTMEIVPPVTKPDTTIQKSVECSQQRMALLKSLLGFFKDLFANQTHADQIRRVMDVAVPRCLRHIISNPQYYGPTVFLNAVDLVTRYIYQEPSLLSQLQDSGFTNVVLFALIIRDVPATREVLAQLPAAFSALCLNQRGLQTFVRCRPFDRLMKFLFSPEYLPAMQRRTGGKDAGGNSDTARSLGLAVDDMMRHQPALRPDTMRALVKLLEQLGAMGRDKSAAWAGVIATAESSTTPNSNVGTHPMFHQGGDDGGSTSDDDEDGVNLPPLAVVGVAVGTQNANQNVTALQPAAPTNTTTSVASPAATSTSTNEPARRKPPVTEFIYNTMRFMEAMLSSNATDDHCTAFANQGGVKPLLSLLTLPHLPLDFAGYHACDSVAAVVKSMIGLSRNGQLVTKAFELLNEQLRLPILENFTTNAFQQTSSNLWAEASKARNEEDLADPTFAPLIRALSAVHSILSMLFHLSSNQQEVRAVLLTSWASSEGLSLLVQLTQLYTALMWEFSLLVVEADNIVTEHNQQQPTAAVSAHPGDSDKMETTASNGSSVASSDPPPAPTTPTPSTLVVPNDRVRIYKFVAGLVADQLKTFHQLFIHLVRLAAATPSRRTRLGMMVPPVSPASHCLAATGCRAINTALSAGLPAAADTKAKLKYYQIAAGTLTWLYDDSNQPYHILLSYFGPLGCRDALKGVLEYLLTLDPATVQPHAGLPQTVSSAGTPASGSANRPSLPTMMAISVDSTLSDLLTELRRLCSTSVVVDSPNSLQASGATGPAFLPGMSPVTQRSGTGNGTSGADFDANTFVANMQSVAFSLLQQAWTSSPRRMATSSVSPLLVDIMCHVVGSPQLTDRTGAEEEKTTNGQHPSTSTAGTSGSSGASAAVVGPAGIPTASASHLANVIREAAAVLEPRLEPPVSQEHLQQLCDMGFPRELAIDALLNTTNLEQAADYCLTHPAPAAPPAAGAPASGSGEAGQASGSGAPAGGQSLPPAPRSLANSSDFLNYMMMNIPQISRSPFAAAVGLQQPQDASGASSSTSSDQSQSKQQPATLIDPAEVSAFLTKIFNDLLLLVESNQLIVPKVASLLSSAIRAKQSVNGSALFLMLLESTIQLIDDPNLLTMQDGKKRLAARLYLASLLLNGIKVFIDCTLARSLANRLVALLANAEFDSSVKQLPVWIAPAVCYIDVYIESAVGSYLRTFTLKALDKPHRWQWYKSEDRQPKWVDYSAGECRLLDAAYRRGQPTVRLYVNSRSVVGGPPQAGNRRSYTVDLRKMRQVADDSGTGRRIRIATSAGKVVSPSAEGPSTSNDANTMEVDESSSVGGPAREFDFAINEKYRLVEFCVRMLGIEDPDGSSHQAVLLLLARLTSETALCSHFVICGGLRSLVQLPATPTILSLSSVVMLLLRHVLEDTTTVRAMMERLCRTLVGQPTERDREREMMLGHMPNGQAAGQAGSKEFHYFVQLMAPLICKNMDLWQEVCENVVRLQPSPNNKSDDDERSGTTAAYCRLAAHLQQTVSHHSNSTNSASQSTQAGGSGPKSGHTAGQTPQQHTAGGTTSASTSLSFSHQQPSLNESATSMVHMLLSLICQNDEDDTEDQPDHGVSSSAASSKGQSSAAVVSDQKSEQAIGDQQPASSDKQAPVAPKRTPRLFSRNYVLRALAELVRASPAVSLIVVHYQHHPILMSAADSQDTAPTALSLIFDDLLTRPAISNAASRLVAALAACYQCPEAQTGLVSEVKLALGRALAEQESPAKHRHLRCLSEVIQLMIQVCPSQQQAPPPSTFGRPSEKLQQMNNIIRLMYKRGLLADLSKAGHSLDLSSPELAGTVNALLGPLDTLCRAVNSQHLQQQLQAQQQAQRSGTTNTNVTATATTTTSSGRNATDQQPQQTQQPPQQAQQQGHVPVRQHRGERGATLTVTSGHRDTTVQPLQLQASTTSSVALETTQSNAMATTITSTTASSTASANANQSAALQSEGTFSAAADLEESLGPESMPADEPTMEHILERLLNDNHSADIHDLLGVPPVNVGGAHGRRRPRQMVVLEDMSSGEEGEEGDEDEDEDEEGEDEDDNAANITVNLDGTMAEGGGDDSQVREADNNANANARVQNADAAGGRMEVGEVDDEFETADDDDEDENEDGEMGDDDEDEDEEVMEEDEDDEDDEDYGDDQESGATEAISDEAGDHVHGFIPGDIDLMLGALPADDTPTLPPVPVGGVAAAAPIQLPSTTGGAVFAHPLLSRAAVAPTVPHRSNFANAIAGAAGSVGIFASGGPGGQFRQPRGIGFFPRQRQNAGMAGGNIQAMVFEELNADFFRHVFGDLLGEDVDYRHGLGGGHFDQFIADSNRRHGIFLGGGAGGRVRGDAFLQDGLPAGGWQTVGGIDLNGRFDSPSAVIADVPSTLQRWSEEARLLYGNHVHDMVLAADRRLYSALCRVREREVREQQQEQQKQQQQAQQAQQQSQQTQQQSSASALAAVGFSMGSRPPHAAVVVEENAGAAVTAPSRSRHAAESGGSSDHRSARTNPPPVAEQMEAAESPSSSSRVIETPVIVHQQHQAAAAANDLIRGAAGLSVDEMQTLASLMTFGDSSTATSSSESARNSDSARADSNVEQPMEAEASGMSGAQAAQVSESVSPSRQMEVSVVPQTAEEIASAEAVEPTTTTVVSSTAAAAASSSSGPTDLSLSRGPTTTTSTTIPATTAASATVPSSSGAAAGGSSDMPLGLEGIDPSFLEALPDNIRQEVIAEQIRLQTMRRQLQESRDVLQRLGIPQDQVAEISPEFLAALPPQIQEEIVAAQQAERSRLLDEQQRAAAAAAGTSAPSAPAASAGAGSSNTGGAGPSSGAQPEGIDPATFLATLPASLRQQVLADMDDSLVNILPQDLAAEARRLRQEAEERQARVLQQRLNDFPASLDFVYGLRPPGVGRGRFAAFRTSLPIGRTGRPLAVQLRDAAAEARAAAAENAVRQLLDHEGLSCLVILLFVTESRTYAARLKSLLLCLCQHKPTRVWIIDTLISILRRAADTQGLSEHPGHHQRSSNEAGGWLNIGMESALGGRTRVFQLPHLTGKRAATFTPTIGIHPQAATTVCRQALDILQALAKNFPSQFLQPMTNPLVTDSTGTVHIHQQIPQNQSEPDFWEVLLKLDNPQSVTTPTAQPSTPSKRGRLRGGTSESGQATSASLTSAAVGVASTPLGALMALLGGANVKRSQQLTDKILALMNMVAQLPNLPALMNECQRSAEPPSKSTSSATPEEINQQSKESDQAIIPKLLPLVINAMIGKACSEEGLEDATSLLGHVSLVNKSTCELVKQLLIGAARDVGRVVCSNVRSLLADIDRVCPPMPTEGVEGAAGDSSSGQLAAAASNAGQVTSGRLTDRYTGTEVIVSAPKKAVILPADLQLPSVSLFTCRTASQRYLLRILKAIRQLQQQHQAANANAGAAAIAAAMAGVVGIRQNSVAPPATTTTTTTTTAAVATTEQAQPSTSTQSEQVLLAEQLGLDDLWLALSDSLTRLELSADPQAVLLLQPAVEAFFIVHSKPPERPPLATQPRTGLAQQQQQQQQQAAPTQHIVPPEPLSAAVTPMTPTQPQLPPDQQLFVHFAEKHRVVLNQILRQSTQPLSEGPFAVLTNYTRILDFDVKRRYFRQELERMDEGRRRDDLAVHVRRQQVFEDSYRELHRRLPEEWKARFFVIFDGEEGQDAGGLLREWFVILSREIFNPHYALFRTSPGDRVTYSINELSSCHLEHLSYFKFVGQLIAKAIYENKLLDCYFTRSFYKHILGISVKYTDMESEDYTLYRNLVYLLEHNAAELGLDLTLSTEIPEFGVMRVRDLKPNGRNLPVTEENKREYVQLLCQMKMTGAIEQQLESFLDGFYSIIPRRLISIFNEQELELLICGLPTVDIEDLRVNTEYHKYQPQSLQIQWLWRALRSFSDAERARFMQFVTGTSKVPLGGFANLEGMHGAQKFQIHRDDRSTERLPTAHTCFNQLDLPPYETYDKLREMLLIAITEGSEGFGFA